MRRLLYVLLCISIFSACGDKIELSDSQSKTFNKFYGDSGADEACEIKELADGSFLIFGTLQTAGQGTDMVLIKTDKFGNEQWIKPFGRSSDDRGGSFDISDNGNIIMVGTSNNPDTELGDINHTDILMVEVDQSGHEINRKLFEGDDNEEGNCILYDQSALGGYIIGGSNDKAIASIDTSTGIEFSNNKFVKNFYFIRVFQENGEIIEYSNSGFEGDDEIYSGIYSDDENGNFIFTGVQTFEGVKRPATTIVSNKNESDQGNGSEILSDLNGPGAAQKIIKTNFGYAISGTFISGSNDVIFIKKLNFKGELFKNDEGLFTVTRNGSVRSHSILYNSSNENFLVAGSTNISSGGGFDHYMAEITGEGNVLWEQSFGGSGTEESLAIARTNDGGYVIAGYSGFEGNSLINVIKTDNRGILNP